MDLLKQAFDKVKQDLFFLNNQIDEIKNNSFENRKRLIELCEIISTTTIQNKDITNSIKSIEERFVHYDSVLEELVTTLKIISDKVEDNNKPTPSTDKEEKPTNSTHNSTEESPFKPQKAQIMPFSTGNGGVPTDRQTNQQTDRQTHESSHNHSLLINEQVSEPPKRDIENAAEILDSLDNIKKEIRLKFKRLTDQELLVFSTIYQLEEQGEQVDYKTIANKLHLTESSIRDYVGRLIKKGVPVDKIKINNKSINLSISPNLKKIASLSTILQLKDL